MALLEALKYLKSHNMQNEQIDVVMDSRYVLNAIQKKWLRGWRRRGWKKADGSKLQNKQLWQQIDANLREFPRIQYFWTKGHADDKGNVYVDHLLNKRMDKMAKKSPQSAETPQPAHHKPAEKPQRIEDKPKISQTKTSQPKLAPRTSHSVSDIEKSLRQLGLFDDDKD